MHLLIVSRDSRPRRRAMISRLPAFSPLSQSYWHRGDSHDHFCFLSSCSPLWGPAPPLIESIMIRTRRLSLCVHPRTAGCEFRWIVSVEHFPASTGWYVRYWVSKRAGLRPLCSSLFRVGKIYSSPARTRVVCDYSANIQNQTVI